VVPNVEGLTESAAITLLREEGFEYADSNDVPSDQPAGIVVGSDPAQGTTQDAGTEVTLDVSNGEVQVPNVEGDSEASLLDFFVGAGEAAPVRRLIQPRSLNQQTYVQAMAESDIVLAVGPAGTGKTYLAVAAAAAALVEKRVKRLVLVRPAVEAGEKLGFLPGDLAEKVNPYLRPLYDALNDILGFDKVGRMMERGQIEVAPLAFMRGRTLNESFVILDEAQNTTREQMKMFLTRIGNHSKAVVTGDVTQIDLPRNVTSGLKEAIEVLRDVEGVGFARFDERDVVRHPIVQQIVTAYDRYESRETDSE